MGEGVDIAFAQQVLERRDAWVGQAPTNYRVVVLTEIADIPVVAKFFPTTHARHLGHRVKDAAYRRLLPRYAASEAKGHMHLSRAGLNVPSMLCWGERWHRGRRFDGVVVTQFMPERSLQDHLLENDLSWVPEAARTIAQMHNAGLIHSDAYPRNFFWVDGQISIIDFEGVTKLTLKEQLNDITRLFVPLWVQTGDEAPMEEAFAWYCSHCKKPPTHMQWRSALEKAVKGIGPKWPDGWADLTGSYVINEL